MALKIREMEMPKSQYNTKCPYSMVPEFIVIHNTAGTASAENEIAYMQRNTNQVSFHYAVDENEAVLGSPLNRNCWHAGDGANGEGNRKGIAIEICRSAGDEALFRKAEENGAELAAMILLEHGWDISKVKKHQDFSSYKKYCPHKTLDWGWDRFLKMVQSKMDSLKKAGSGTTTTSGSSSSATGIKTGTPGDGNTPHDWSKEAVSWAVARGILKGSSAGSIDYKLNDPVTREQVLVFLYRAING